MNHEEKQIEEMAYSICNANKKLIKSCRECPIFQGYKYPCVKKEFAEKFYNAGCRMQSDTAREILRMIKDKGLLRYGGYLLHDSDFDTVGKLYGVEVEE